MKHFFSTRVRVVLVLAVLLAVILAVVSNLTGLSVPDMFVKGVLSPIRAGASKLTEQAQQLYNYMFEYESLQAENEVLKEQIAQMEEDARKADSVSRENDRLRALLELKTAHEDYKLVDCYIISRSSQQWSSTFTVNKGTASGVQEGMCAVTANGELVGLVSEAGSNYAVVKSVLDSSLEISATIASSGYNGMTKGGYFYKDINHLKMDYLPSSAIIRNLITNAIKFSSKGSEVSVDLTEAEEYSIIKVADKGVGMSQKKVEELLSGENITSTSGTEDEVGYGFGFRIVLDYVHKNKGTLNIESKLFHCQNVRMRNWNCFLMRNRM